MTETERDRGRAVNVRAKRREEANAASQIRVSRVIIAFFSAGGSRSAGGLVDSASCAHLISSSHAESSRVSLSPSCIVLSISLSASVVGQAGQHEDHLANGLTAVIVISSPFMQKPLESPAGRHGLSIMTISTWADRGPQARDAEISWSSSLHPVALGMDHSFVHVPPASFSLARVNQL